LPSPLDTADQSSLKFVSTDPVDSKESGVQALTTAHARPYHETPLTASRNDRATVG